jgi:hypothetical protein
MSEERQKPRSSLAVAIRFGVQRTDERPYLNVPGAPSGVPGQVLECIDERSKKMGSWIMECEEIKRRIIELQVEHRDLDEAIARMAEQSGMDEIKLRRMKKRKLQIKDTISMLQMRLVPDIPA